MGHCRQNQRKAYLDIRISRGIRKTNSQSAFWGGPIPRPFFYGTANMILTNLPGITPEFRRETVPVPEIQPDGEVLIREMSGGEIADFRARMKDAAEIDLAAYMLYTAVIDEAGNRQFPDVDTAGQFLRAIPAKCADRITAAIFKLNTGETEKN